MENVWVPLISGLIGVLIGSLASIISMVIQTKNESRRELIINATNLSVQDYQHALSLAKDSGTIIYPLSLYFHYHLRILEYASKGKLSKGTLLKIKDEQQELMEAIKEFTKNK